MSENQPPEQPPEQQPPEQPGSPQQPGYPQPGYPQQPGYSQPGYSQPAYAQPGYPPPPGYQQPGYPPPGYPPPGYQQGPPMPPPRKRHGVRNGCLISSGVVGVAVILIIVIVAALGSGGGGTSTSRHHHYPHVSLTSPTAQPVNTQPAAPQYTIAQKQAIISAESYLSSGQGFSRKGLIHQLSSKYGEGFSMKLAVFAVDHVKVNWRQQAVISARSYLHSGQGFSCSGLVDQLSSPYGEQFTRGQAEFAAKAVGLC